MPIVGTARFTALVCAAIALATVRPASATALDGRFVFRTYGKEDGLADPNVKCLLQDKQGFLWIGTDGGLYRFGGRRFTRFGREDGLLANEITIVHETRDGRLFVGTAGGLSRLDGERFVPLGAAHGLPESTIPFAGIASDAATIFVGTRNGLFVSDDGDHFRLEPRDDGRPESVVYGMHLDPSGALVFARAESGLYRRRDGAVTNLGAAHGLATSEWMDATLTDRAGRLWVRTPKHLYVLAPDDDRFRQDDDDLPLAMDSGRLALDDRGELLVPTIRGVARKDWTKKRWAILGAQQGLETDTATSALVDREGSLWIGLDGGGVARRVGRGAFTAWTQAQGLSYDRAAAVMRDRSGALWVGTTEGLNRIDATGGVRVWRENDGLAGNDAVALAAGADGSVWVGAWTGGVARIAPDGKVKRYAVEGLDPAQVHVVALHAARSGDVWVGTWNGVLRLAPGADRFARVALPGASEPDTIDAFAEDASGAVWAATRFGLARVSGAPHRFGQKSGLRAPYVRAIVGAPDGSLAISYDDPPVGVDRVEIQDDAIVVTPLVVEPSTSRGTHVLGVDASQALWLTTGSGIDVVGMRGDRLARYGAADGLPSDAVMLHSFVADPDGSAWFGTARGLVRFRPRVDPAPRPHSRVAITQLEQRDRSVRIAWESPTFVEPEKVRYRWRLAGLNDAFTTTTLDEVRFSALPSGSYRFEVSAISAAGVESERAAQIAFDVMPAWWERWWARGGALVALVVLGAGVVRLRTRALEADRRRLEAAVDARSRELARANRELAEMSFTDALTGLRNRRYYETVVGDHVARVTSHYAAGDLRGPTRNRDLVVYVVDVDHFKSVNDTHGHEAGDRVLREIARRLADVIRKTDLLVRWGGEEFVVLSTDSDRVHADVLARRILAAVARTPIDIGDRRSVMCTCSIGWAPLPFFTDAPTAVTHDEALKLADRALYRAKRDGRARAIGLRAGETRSLEDGALDVVTSTVRPGEDPPPMSVRRPSNA